MAHIPESSMHPITSHKFTLSIALLIDYVGIFNDHFCTQSGYIASMTVNMKKKFKLYSLWQVDHMYEVSRRSVKRFQRRRFLFLRFYFQSNIATRSHDWWRYKFNSALTSGCRSDVWSFRFLCLCRRSRRRHYVFGLSIHPSVLLSVRASVCPW